MVRVEWHWLSTEGHADVAAAYWLLLALSNQLVLGKAAVSSAASDRDS
mgnify:CR=1 FL=1